MMSFRSCFIIEQIMYRLCKLIRKKEYLGPMKISGLWLGVYFGSISAVRYHLKH